MKRCFWIYCSASLMALGVGVEVRGQSLDHDRQVREKAFEALRLCNEGKLFALLPSELDFCETYRYLQERSGPPTAVIEYMITKAFLMDCIKYNMYAPGGGRHHREHVREVLGPGVVVWARASRPVPTMLAPGIYLD